MDNFENWFKTAKRGLGNSPLKYDIFNEYFNILTSNPYDLEFFPPWRAYS